MLLDIKASERLTSFRGLLDHARERLRLDLGFRLWDGSLVPSDRPQDAPAIAITDENVVAALLRAPKAETLANLWVAGRIDILNGSIFDLVAQRPSVRAIVRAELGMGDDFRDGEFPASIFPYGTPSEGM